MAAKTEPQHAGNWEDVSKENLDAEREAWNWKRTNGSHIPGTGQHRKESALQALARRLAA